jgi:Protein of unknown function (DUF3352)
VVGASAADLQNLKQYAGDEVDVVFLDLQSDRDYVVITKPPTKEKLDQFLKLGGDAFSQGSVDDWAVAGDAAAVDRFEELAKSGDKLADDDGFKQGFDQLDAGTSARWWVRGEAVQSALDRSLVSSGAPPRLSHDLGDLQSLSGSFEAETEGVRADAYGLIDPAPDPDTFSPSLPAEVPGGAVLYVSSTDLAAPVRAILRLVSKSRPNFDTQRSQVEGVLGLSLEDDVFPLLKSESALAVYPGAGAIPPILFLQKVGDEDKAESLLKRIAAIAQLSGDIKVDTVSLPGGESMQRFQFPPSDVSVYDGVAHGKVFVTNSQGLGGEIVAGNPSDTLADDPLYRSARKAADMPDQVAGFAYGDLKNGLPYAFRLAQRSGSAVPPEAFTNVKPLNGSLAYLVKDGDALRMSGFATIK